MPSLRIASTDKSAPSVYYLFKTLTTIGSSADCDVVLGDPLVADVFAHIQHDGHEFHVTAIPRGAEFSVAGKKRKKHRLAHQDRLGIGSFEITFSLTDDRPEEPAEPPAAGVELGAYQTLHAFSARLAEASDLKTLLDDLMDGVCALTCAEKGFLILCHGDTIDVAAARNLVREDIADAVSQLSDAIVAKVVKTGKPVIVSDAMSDAEFASSVSVMSLRLSSVMCVPLLHRGSLLGAIYVGASGVSRLFDERTLAVLSVFAAQAALVVANALLVTELRLETRTLQDRLAALQFGELVGASPVMQEIFKKVQKVAQADVGILVTGETGTGKELIAREIHARSPRAKGPFVSINCGAIPENLLESELFGHVRGAFTGAVASRPGKFHAADKGTLFLDEIGEMPTPLQVKILRALQERQVVRVGDTRPESVDIRIVAATNRDLPTEIKAGRFREDLYYRLNVIQIHLPPLRDRGDDVVAIARFLIARMAPQFGGRVKGLSMPAMSAIRKHRWPGNIRELENRLKKAMVLADKPLLSPEDLDLRAEDLPPILSLAEAKEKFQRDYINEVLGLNNGNRTKTARDLGVDPRTIFRHLEKEGEEGGEPGPAEIENAT
jgi:transcriptional regulator with GAF, ATPase, and Fis domain